jgi:hypothetical protein
MWSQKIHLTYWRRTIINSPEDGTQCLPFSLLTVEEGLGSEEFPGQIIHQKWLPHDITISPISLDRGANQKQVPHDITDQISLPAYIIRSNFLMTTQSVQFPWNFRKYKKQLSGWWPWQKGQQLSCHLEECSPALWGRHVIVLGA